MDHSPSPFAARPAACAGCPAHERGYARSFVPPTGPSTARVAILGQGPGCEEAYQRRPFIGPSGQRLNMWLAAAKIPRAEVAIANVTWCAMTDRLDPWKDRKPSVAEVAHCRRAHWEPWLRSLPNLQVAVAVGVPAMSAFIPGAGAKSAGIVKRITLEGVESVSAREIPKDGVRPVACGAEHRGPGSAVDGTPPSAGAARGAGGCAQLPAAVESGRPNVADRDGGSGRIVGHRDDGAAGEASHTGSAALPVDVPRSPLTFNLVGILHPAFILRGQFSQEKYQIGHLIKVRALLDGTYVWQPPVAQGPPGARTNPTCDEIVQWLSQCGSAALDIEWSGPHITVLGLWGRNDYASMGGITIRFRERGDPYPWSWDEWRRIVRALHRWLGSPHVMKSAHNGQSADVWMLERMGFRIEGYDFDTMLAVHIGDPERKKDLETVGTAMAGVPHWKWLAKGEGAGEGK